MEYILITTEFRGVFFGTAKDKRNLPEKITLYNARNCIHWSQDMEGFLGLAVKGPSETCKIGVKTPSLTLYKITSYAEVTAEAAKKWENA